MTDTSKEAVDLIDHRIRPLHPKTETVTLFATTAIQASNLLRALAAERDALQAQNHTLTGERNKARQEKFKLQEALREIASPTQTTNLLWWQEAARQALSAIKEGER